MSKYVVLQQPVETILSWIKSGEIAIPEIQRPFVWKSAKVRDLIDSLYKGYPVGYIITWRNPDVKLRDGQLSPGKRVLIDGQQRITALTAAVLGQRVLDSNYKEIGITISFNPITEIFEVLNTAYERSPQWINNINPIINDEITMSRVIREYLQLNPDVDEGLIEERIENLKRIKNKQVGIIELDHQLDIDTVTEIFIRINQKGVVLSNADFVMSKIASDEAHGGNTMRKLIDYFCRLIADKNFNKHILDNVAAFKIHPYYQAIKWMATANDTLYKPDYIGVLRVAFTYKFNRGKFSDLVALLSGRNFETRTFEGEIVEKSFQTLEAGLLAFVNQTNYKRFLVLIQSAGLISNKLISSKTSLHFSYALFLKLREQGMPDPEIQHYVKRWLILVLLIGRYSGASESNIDDDIRQINTKGIAAYLQEMENAHLGDNYWSFGLQNQLETSSTNNNAYNVYLAAQCYFNTHAFLAKNVMIRSLIEQRGDVHHIFPKAFLQNHGRNTITVYNQVANYVFTEQSTNIKVGKLSPNTYLGKVQQEINAGTLNITSLTNDAELRQNLLENDIPESIFHAQQDDYEQFLKDRRTLMAQKIKRFYEQL